MSTHEEREFDANYKALTNKTLPNYTPQQIDKYKDAIKGYYDQLSQDLKDKYKSQYESLFPKK